MRGSSAQHTYHYGMETLLHTTTRSLFCFSHIMSIRVHVQRTYLYYVPVHSTMYMYSVLSTIDLLTCPSCVHSLYPLQFGDFQLSRVPSTRSRQSRHHFRREYYLHTDFFKLLLRKMSLFYNSDLTINKRFNCIIVHKYMYY